jgi:hypothetical protein
MDEEGMAVIVQSRIKLTTKTVKPGVSLEKIRAAMMVR